ncbi:hypothetical protein [Arthrobacter sp. JCM 19049]|uniref:hypothetical protein n=1 Tax=Arthrobacter sp. JCM 19049 TaxID=1460643 RepID=UPI002436EBE6|nr:hypothetical protein [Arthrobacter sp. JCM 19049]
MHSAGLSLAVLLLASAALSGCVSVQPENGTETSSGPITSPSAPEQGTQSPTAQPSPSSSAPAATSSQPRRDGRPGGELLGNLQEHQFQRRQEAGVPG